MLFVLFSLTILMGKTLVTVNGHQITDKIIPPGYEKLTDEQRSNLIEQLAKEEVLYQDLLKSSIVNDPKFNKAFNEQKKIAAQKYKQQTGKNLNKEQIRAIKASIALALYQQKMYQQTKVSQSEIKSYYNNNPKTFQMPDGIEIGDIVLKNKAEAQKIIKSLKEKKGKELDKAFLKIAHDHKQNGYVGWLFRGNSPDKLFNKAFKYKKKRIVNTPVEVKGTYNVVYLLNKKKAGKISFKDAKKRIEQMLKQKKVIEKLRNKVDKLYGQAEIILN